jgi:hypothetical protein
MAPQWADEHRHIISRHIRLAFSDDGFIIFTFVTHGDAALAP